MRRGRRGDIGAEGNVGDQGQDPGVYGGGTNSALAGKHDSK
jgi:hypothetical protein